MQKPTDPWARRLDDFSTFGFFPASEGDHIGHQQIKKSRPH